MEQLLKRRLKKKEVVHHLNGKKDDNRPENLLVFHNNGDHLGVELLGKKPKWTEEGLRKIRSRSIPSMKGIPQSEKGTGVRRSRRKLIEKFLLETNGMENTGPAAELPKLPSFRKQNQRK